MGVQGIIINLIFVLFFYLQFCKVFGYVEVVITSGEEMDMDPSFADFSKFRVKKINRTHFLTGDIYYKEEMSNDIKLEIVLFKKQGGEYRKTQFKLPMRGFCDFYNTETFVIPEFQNYCLNCPKQEEKLCPWPAQIYKIKEFTFKAKDVPPYLDGEYMALVQYYKDSKLLGGYKIFGNIIR